MDYIKKMKADATKARANVRKAAAKKQKTK